MDKTIMLPDEIKAIRAELGLTQVQLAPMLGYVNVQRVSALETGARECPWHIGQLMRCYKLLKLRGIPK